MSSLAVGDRSNLPPPGVVTDLRMEMRFGWGTFLLSMLAIAVINGLGTVLIMWGMRNVLPGFPPAAVGAISGVSAVVLLFGGASLLFRRRTQRRSQEFGRKLVGTPEVPAEELLKECLRSVVRCTSLTANISPVTRMLLHDLAIKLAGSRGRGMTLRLARASNELLPEIVPLTVPFEPIPLDETAEGFWALRGGRLSWRERVALVYQQMARTLGDSLSVRIFIGFSLLLAAVGFGVMIVTALVEILRGTLPRSLLPMAIAFVAVLPIVIVRMVRPVQWFVIPGAIVVRQARGRETVWNLTRVTRADGALIYWREANLLAIATAEGRGFARMMTPTVAEMALRAWLSPVPTPPLAQLGDLA